MTEFWQIHQTSTPKPRKLPGAERPSGAAVAFHLIILVGLVPYWSHHPIRAAALDLAPSFGCNLPPQKVDARVVVPLLPPACIGDRLGRRTTDIWAAAGEWWCDCGGSYRCWTGHDVAPVSLPARRRRGGICRPPRGPSSPQAIVCVANARRMLFKLRCIMRHRTHATIPLHLTAATAC